MQIFNKAAEAKVVEKLATLKNNLSAGLVDGWSALYFAFDKLSSEQKSDYEIKIALNMMEDLLRDKETEVFVCRDFGIFLFCVNAEQQLLEKVVFQLRYLFVDDPLAYNERGEEKEGFCHFYPLPESFEELDKFARMKMLAESRNDAAKNKNSKTAQNENNVPSLIFNANKMAKLEGELSKVDVSSVVSCQSICTAATAINPMRRVFDELYINISQLRQLLKLDVDLHSNRWLFKYLTEILDLRVLQLLQASPTKYMSTPISLNLNVRTLLSDQFMEFDASIKPFVKISLILEIQLSDVFEDMRAFFTARDIMQKMGYRICLDGVTDLTFTQIAHEKMGFDLVKLQWNADSHNDVKAPDNKKIAERVKACGSNRVILSRCDNRKAVEYGQSLGISLFQGRYLDKIVDPMLKVEN